VTEDRCCRTCLWIEHPPKGHKEHRFYNCTYPIESISVPDSLKASLRVPYARDWVRLSDGATCKTWAPMVLSY